jgi:hypothetical protein
VEDDSVVEESRGRRGERCGMYILVDLRGDVYMCVGYMYIYTGWRCDVCIYNRVQSR